MTAFNRDTTTDEVLEGVNLSGRRIVVTGAASGLGFESSRALAQHGAAITMLARSAERAEDARSRLSAMLPDARLEAGVVDLSDLSSIASFSQRYLASHDAIDVLINNAGVMACPYGRTADGFEMQFGTNHLGHFALTARLAPAILAGDEPRVVTLSSAGHSRSDVDLEDYNFEATPYDPWIAYGRSKTANALFARELAARAGQRGLLSFSVHPGGIVTELGRHLDDQLRNNMAAFARERALRFNDIGDDGEPRRMQFKSVPAGAATQVWAATAATLSQHNGAYLADCGVGVQGVNPTANGFMDYLLDDARARELWTLSERLTGVSFP